MWYEEESTKGKDCSAYVRNYVALCWTSIGQADFDCIIDWRIALHKRNYAIRQDAAFLAGRGALTVQGDRCAAVVRSDDAGKFPQWGRRYHSVQHYRRWMLLAPCEI